MARYQQSHRRDGGHHRSNKPKKVRDRRRGSPNPRGSGGPQTCPMCGDLVNDLRNHIEARHDDADSHPRDF